MLRLLVLCLIWMSGVLSDTGMPKESEMMMMDKMSMDAMMLKEKRDSFPHISSPCPPFYPNHGVYVQPQILSKPYGPPNYPRDHHVQYIHQPTYQAVIPKTTVTYLKPHASSVNVEAIHNSVHPISPVHHQSLIVKPYVQPYVHAEPKVVYQKPMFEYAPYYHKPMYEYAKIVKPIQHVPYQHYQEPKVVHVQPQPLHYVKLAHQQPMHYPIYAHSAPIHAPIVKTLCP